MIKNKLGKILITGGTGFIGSCLANFLLRKGYEVVIFDNNARGKSSRLESKHKSLSLIEGDITNFKDVNSAATGIDTIFHLAFINGTDNFYNFPEKVLEVGVKGAINTLDAAIQNNVSNYIVTSSSEVYQEPTQIPTDEKERIIIPDILNPRFSYSGGKIITELLTIHYLKKANIRSIICRPHNFYGPDMGEGHVIPQITRRMLDERSKHKNNKFEFEIQGSGKETRAFCYIDDAVDGIYKCAVYGNDKEIYHIGTIEEISINYLVKLISKELGCDISIKCNPLRTGSTLRRCPDITKMKNLGYEPKVSINDGVIKTVNWYINNPSDTLNIENGYI